MKPLHAFFDLFVIGIDIIVDSLGDQLASIDKGVRIDLIVREGVVQVV